MLAGEGKRREKREGGKGRETHRRKRKGSGVSWRQEHVCWQARKCREAERERQRGTATATLTTLDTLTRLPTN